MQSADLGPTGAEKQSAGVETSDEAKRRFSRPFAPNVRFERVEEIRKALALGTYSIASSAVADSLIAHLRRS
jgi:flagellar biosynthesis anti-sigma factor FlgM